jgi:hypothetical protein
MERSAAQRGTVGNRRWLLVVFEIILCYYVGSTDAGPRGTCVSPLFFVKVGTSFWRWLK